MRFIDLFAGLGGFHIALEGLDHECVFASEIDDELRELYMRNFPKARKWVFGDIRKNKNKIPSHDILCAGFPCQPFSKSGAQRGFEDETRGTLFHEILEIIETHNPRCVILENVGNFERHDGGRTWEIVKRSLSNLGYVVRGTEHVASGGHGLISPHHLGFPQTRERFYVVATRYFIHGDPFPPRIRNGEADIRKIVQPVRELTTRDHEEVHLPPHYVIAIDHWNKFLGYVPRNLELPSFPIWGDELDAKYPFETSTPFGETLASLKRSMGLNGSPYRTKQDVLELLPSYARVEELQFPKWKQAFIRQNRTWFQKLNGYLPNEWKATLRSFPPSLRKLEWNCHGEDRDLWRHILQFRPSGLRAKKYTTSPALVAMTESQIPILGPERRFITRVEGLALQGFPKTHFLPNSRESVFRALGNAVHVGVVSAIAQKAIQ